jgi:hypothetical protein
MEHASSCLSQRIGLIPLICCWLKPAAPGVLHWALAVILVLFLNACASRNHANHAIPEDALMPCIEWDPGTRTLIHAGGCYGRMIRLQNGQWLACFESGGGIAVRHSADEGRTWGEPVIVATWPAGSLANPDVVQLRDGTVLCFYNERPANAPRNIRDAVDNRPPYAISVVRGNDEGKAWEAPTRLYAAGTTFDNGCWEPAAIELSSGEVQLFFANEGPYRASHEQEITMLRSFDSGKTWSDPETVALRAGHRDGMPSPLVLGDGRGIAVAIEDDGLGGPFKPAIIFTPAAENFCSGPVDGDSPRRWSALHRSLPSHVYAGAPSLRQLPSGWTLLSFQQSDTGTVHQDVRMVVCVGDADARGFGAATQPFPVEAGSGQYWNSLFVKDAWTVMALSTTSIGGVWGLWSIEGRVVDPASACPLKLRQRWPR